ncbi:MAG TPA: hypothetical protein VM261_20035 [Kofleriaceae bacterium]|nr:hypothetical protein [Kofleriaceae bacterium]
MRARALAAFAIACAVLVAPPRPAAIAEGLDYKAFKNGLLEGIGPKVDAEIAKLDAEMATAAPDVKAELAKARAELVLFKKRVEDVATVDAIYDSITSVKGSMEELEEALANPYSSPVHPDILAGKKVAAAVQASKLLGQGLDYYSKYQKLAEDLGAIDSALMSPGTKRMAQSLTALSHIMATFGDKLPMFGSLVKAYGDLAVELTKTTLALDAKIAALEQGQLLPGVHGERGTMFDALAKLGIQDAQRVDGTRDVFRGSDGRLLIWDREARDWVVASDVEQGITEDEIIKRYLFFMNHGTAEPTPEQIVRGYHRAIVLELVPSTDHVAPGGTVTLKVVGKMAHDQEVIAGKQLFATVTMTSHTGLGEGELQNAERVRLGDAATWVAPNNLNETYTFAANLAEETTKVALSGGPATATVRTGAETRLELTAAATEVAAKTPVELTAKLFTVDGKPVPPTAAGLVDITVAPALGFFTDWSALGDQKGATATWMTPEQPGRYVVTARYAGATGYSMFKDHTAGAEATIYITVGQGVDAGVADAGEGDGGDLDAEDVDASEARDAGDDGAPIDWPGTWKGKMKTTLVMDGQSHVSDEVIELEVKRGPGGKIMLTRPGMSPAMELTPTPSNPRAATATQTLPRPAGGTATVLKWDAQVKYTAFLAEGKLNLAVHLTIEQDVIVMPDQPVVHSSHISDSIGQLEKIR